LPSGIHFKSSLIKPLLIVVGAACVSVEILLMLTQTATSLFVGSLKAVADLQ
jgi:hypothetical protein